MRTSSVSALDLRPSRVARRLAPLLPAAALGLGGCALAAFERGAGAATAAETEYLSVWAAFVLAGAALLAPPRHRGSLTAPVIAALAIWVLPGPARGVALGVWLVAAAAAAAWSRLRPAARERWDGAAWLGVALALHGLLRPADLLPATLSPLEHGPGPLARLLLPPLAAALGLALLARRRGAASALAAGTGAALAAAGMTATAAMPLLALAVAGEVAAARRGRAPRPADGTSPRRLVAGALRSPSALAAAAAGVALVGLVLLRPAAGGLALAAGAALALPGLPGLAAAALPLAAGLGLTLGRGGGVEALAGLWQLALLLPIALLPGKAPARSVLGALLLAAGGLLLLPAPPALAAAAALLALELRQGSATAAAQRVWLAALLALAALAAAYPWLRPEPLLAAWTLLGVPPGWTGAAAVLAGALAAAGAAWLAAGAAVRREGAGIAPGAPRRTPSDAGIVTASRRSSRAAAAIAVTALVALLAAARPPLSRDLLRGVAIELAGDQSWSHGWRGPARWLRIESLLTGAVALPAGTPVGEVRLESRGRVVDRLILRVGRETAEWAADRPELRGRVASAPPAVSWVAPDGRSFGHAYRAARHLGGGAVDRVVVAGSPALPPGTILVVRRLEVAR